MNKLGWGFIFKSLLTGIFIIFLISSLKAGAEEHLITILHTNDSHSSLHPHSTVLDYNPDQFDPSSGGIARLATLIDQQRESRQEEGQEVFTISAGDFLGGDPYAWLTLNNEAVEIELLKRMGYDLVTIGNHEFDYGPEILAGYFKKAGYPQQMEKPFILAANIETDESPLSEIGIRDSRLIETDSGLKIGFLGLIGNEAVSLAHNTGELNFCSPVETARAVTAELKNRGADIIIAISHSGLEEDKILAGEVEDLDIIIGGHSHHALKDAVIVDDTTIVQAGYRLEYMGVLELSYDPENSELQIVNEQNKQPYLIEIDDRIEENKEFVELVSTYTAKLNQYLDEISFGKYHNLFEPVFSLDFSVSDTPPLTETSLGNLLTDAMRIGVEDITGQKVDFAFQANGLLRAGIKPAVSGKDEGWASYYQLAAASGLGIGPDGRPGYPLVELYLTGEEVKNVLEISVLLSDIFSNSYFLQNSGLRYSYDRRRAILFNLPVLNKPLPTGRAVLNAERYTGKGIQTDNDDDYKPLPGENGRLYRVVTDYYLMQFLPQVGEVVPSLQLELKKEDGSLLENREEAIIRHNGREIKVWEALFHYADLQNGSLNSVYKGRSGRIVEVKKFSPLVYPLATILVLLVLIIAVIYLFLQKRKK